MSSPDGTETMADIEEYYIRLRELYGDTPVLCITPIWRGDSEDGEPTLIRFCENLKDICRQYSNITIVDGFTLVPHLSEYFLDNLHPNCLGCEVYGTVENSVLGSNVIVEEGAIVKDAVVFANTVSKKVTEYSLW